MSAASAVGQVKTLSRCGPSASAGGSSICAWVVWWRRMASGPYEGGTRP